MINVQYKRLYTLVNYQFVNFIYFFTPLNIRNFGRTKLKQLLKLTMMFSFCSNGTHKYALYYYSDCLIPRNMSFLTPQLFLNSYTGISSPPSVDFSLFIVFSLLYHLYTLQSFSICCFLGILIKINIPLRRNLWVVWCSNVVHPRKNDNRTL